MTAAAAFGIATAALVILGALNMGFYRTAALALCLPLWLSPVARAECGLTRVAMVPMQVTGSRFLVDASINGKPASLILDTGDQLTTLSFDALHRLGVGWGGQFGLRIVGIGGSRPSEKAELKSFNLGTLHASDLTIRAVDFPSGTGFHDGLLGMDLLSSYDMDIDVLGHRLILYTWHGGCSHPAAALDGELSVVELLAEGVETTTRVSGNTFYWQRSIRLSPRVRVSIGGREFTALLDSGAPRSAMFRNVAASLGLATDMSKAAVRVGGVGPARVGAVRVTVPDLDVGDLSLINVPMTVADQASDDNVDLILGNDFMQSAHVWISHSSHNAIFQYPPARSPAP